MFQSIVIWPGCFSDEMEQWVMEKVNNGGGTLLTSLFPESKEKENEQLGQSIIFKSVSQ